MKKARGSALIIAFMLVAAVGGTVLLIGRLFLMDQASSEIYEDSVVAYYSAESGIEEALLRYRYDKDIEMPKTLGVFDATRVARSNMQSSLPAGPTEAYVNRNSIMDADPDNDQRFDLSIASKASYFGNNTDGDATFELHDLLPANYDVSGDFSVPKDEAIKLNIKDTISGVDDLDLYVKAVAPTSKSFIEIKLTGIVGTTTVERKMALRYPDTVLDTTVFPSPSDYSDMSLVGGLYSKVNLKTLLIGSGVNFTGDEVTLSIKPVTTGIVIGLKPTNGGKRIFMPYTDVKSTGYFAGYSRTLSAKIDRQSGTVYDLFDYVIYDKK